MPDAWATPSGIDAVKTPSPPSSEPMRLYRANNAVRSTGITDCASTVCSSGPNKLTSPAVGLIVPMNAMMTSGQYSLDSANAPPVAIISRLAHCSSARRGNRCAIKPMVNVSSAEPINVLVMIDPIASAPKPSSSK